MFEIVRKDDLGKGSYLFIIRAMRIARRAKPGQFVIVRINKFGERIPITIADIDEKEGTITILVQAVGKSTTQLGMMKAGDEISDVVGPLGVPSHIEHFGTVVCMGGGFGIAAIYPIAKALKKIGNNVISIIGARRKDLLLLEEEMRKASTILLIATDDGSYGHHGFVTDVLKKLFEDGTTVNLVYAIGPVPMMKAVCNLTKPLGIKTMVSLNPIMVDGTGMCGVCRVTVGGKRRFACVEGPDFDGHEVDFDELVKRQRMYLDREKEALDRYKLMISSCCGGGEK